MNLIDKKDKKIRVATEADIEPMLEIYKPIITATVISFETKVPTLEEFAERVKLISVDFPWLVCEINGRIAGYAYGNPHRSRRAYCWSADCSVYVSEDFKKRSVATSLYGHLFPMLKSQGYFNVFAGIALPNPASIALHKKMGFTEVGIYKNVGYKLNRWCDVAWYQLILNSSGVPSNPLAFHEITPVF